MNSARTILALVGILTAGTLAAHADTITLKNGDHLNGTLLDISNGLVSFRTTLAGRIMTPADEVVALNTEGLLFVALKDKTALPGRISSEGGGFNVISPDSSETSTIVLADIEQIQRIPESKPDSSAQDEAAKLAITTGYKLRTGTRNASGPTAGAALETTGSRLHMRMEFEGEYTEDADAGDRYMRGAFEVGEADTTKFAPTLILELERDRSRALEMGAQAAAGLRRQLHETDQNSLDGFLGVGVRAEELNPEPLRSDGVDDGALRGASAKDRTDIQLDVRLRYTREVFSRTTLTEMIRVQPSLGDPGEIRAEWESTLSVPITLNVNLNFDLLFDYESDREYDAIDPWNTTFGAGLQIQF